MIDLTKATEKELLKYKQVWFFSTDEMNASDQQTMVNYLNAGGNAVVFPFLPDREMNQKPCTILRDSIKIISTQIEIIDSSLVKLFHLADIKCSNPLVTYNPESIDGATPIAFTLKGSICGFEKNVGKSKVIHLGTWLGFDTEGHKDAYLSILGISKAKLRHTQSDNDLLISRQRFTSEGQGLLFIANYYNENQTGRVFYSHPANGEQLSIPLIDQSMNWPSINAVLSPLNLPLAEGITLLHTTSDILGMDTRKNYINLNLVGDRDILGEIVLEGKHLNRIKSASVSGSPLMLNWHKNRIVLNYKHEHNKEISLTLNFD